MESPKGMARMPAAAVRIRQQKQIRRKLTEPALPGKHRRMEQTAGNRN